MPRVALTAAQRESQSMDRRAQWLADGLAAYRNKNHLSIKQLGYALQLSDKTVSRILDGDHTVRVPIGTLWKMEAVARHQTTESNVEVSL